MNVEPDQTQDTLNAPWPRVSRRVSETEELSSHAEMIDPGCNEQVPGGRAVGQEGCEWTPIATTYRDLIQSNALERGEGNFFTLRSRLRECDVKRGPIEVQGP